jgi:hypothetical protein
MLGLQMVGTIAIASDTLQEETTMTTLRFDGSLWCNVDVALRSLDAVYGRAIDDLELGVIGWYVLRALYQQDGQHASELARAVGRAATSFTPILDKLEDRGLVERCADPHDGGPF